MAAGPFFIASALGIGLLWLFGGKAKAATNGGDKPPVDPPKDDDADDVVVASGCLDAYAASKTTVKEVQLAFLELGIPVPGGADGVCGKGTKGATATFQKDHGIAVTGVVDSATLTAMQDALAALDVKTGKVAGDPAAYANGCNAGSQDAVASIASGTGAVQFTRFVESQSAEWKRAYRECSAQTFKNNGYVLTEDGVSFDIFSGADDGTSIIVGDVLDESEADSDDEGYYF
jgi:peptidoglycan hydrolase-like protein with peptidoglycan-binding domain